MVIIESVCVFLYLATGYGVGLVVKKRRLAKEIPAIKQWLAEMRKTGITVDPSDEDLTITMAINEEAYTPLKYAVFWIFKPVGLFFRYLDSLTNPSK